MDRGLDDAVLLEHMDERINALEMQLKALQETVKKFIGDDDASKANQRNPVFFRGGKSWRLLFP